MNDLETSIRDALHTDADRAPASATEWTGPSVTTAQPNHPKARSMLLAAAAVLVVGGLWVVVRRDTGSDVPSASTATGGVDFSGAHRAAMEALFPPDPGESLYESTMIGSNSGAYELQGAIENAMNSCMKAVGFEYPVPPITRAMLQSDLAPIVRPLSPAQAAQYGYQDPGDAAREAYKTAFDAAIKNYRDTLDSTGQQEFDAAQESCTGTAVNSSFADFAQYESLRVVMENGRNELTTAFAAAAPVQQLDRTWSACMKTKGYDVATTTDALVLAGTETAKATEIAVADADCRTATSYEASYIDLYRNAESAFMYDNQQRIIDLWELRYGKLVTLGIIPNKFPQASPVAPSTTTPTPSGTDTLVNVPTPTTAPTTHNCIGTYVIQKGDVTIGVARRFNTDIATLSSLNKDNPSFTAFAVGSTIFVPSADPTCRP